jgi:hypothetical protein
MEPDSKLAALSDDTLVGILNSIIHRPGWTTLPEAALTQVAMESLHAHADIIRTTYEELIEAAKLVGTDA